MLISLNTLINKRSKKVMSFAIINRSIFDSMHNSFAILYSVLISLIVFSEINSLIPAFLKIKSKILKYYYLWQYAINKYCLMLGYGSIYNHSLAPNADVDYNTQSPENYLTFQAIKDIKTGEEILIDYEFDDNKEDFLKLD